MTSQIPGALLAEQIVLGRGSRALTRSFRRGEFVRITARAYVPVESWVGATATERFVAAASAMALTTPGRILCGRSALAVGGFGAPVPHRLTFAVEHRGGSGPRPAAFAVCGDSPAARAARALPAPRVVGHVHREPPPCGERSGMRFQTADHALFEVLRLAKDGWGLACADAVCARIEERSLMRWDPLLELLDRLEGKAPRARVEGLARSATPLSGSVGESLSRFEMLDAGFPAPMLQHAHHDRDGLIGYSDFWWPLYRLVGEFDGVAKYSDPGMLGGRSAAQAIGAEKRRDNRLLVGNKVAHWDWKVLHRLGGLRGLLMSMGLPAGIEARPWP